MQRFSPYAPCPVAGYGAVAYIGLNREDKRPATVSFAPDPDGGAMMLHLELGGVL